MHLRTPGLHLTGAAAERQWLDAVDALDRTHRELRGLSELVCAAGDLQVVQPENLSSLIELVADAVQDRTNSARAAMEVLPGGGLAEAGQ